MGMDPITLGAIAMGTSSLVGAGEGFLNRRAANRTAQQRQQAATGMMQTTPGPYEQMLQQFLTGMAPPTMSNAAIPTAASIGGGQAFNTGQDALMQLLRANPHTQVDANLDAVARTGLPYNFSPAFDAFRASDTQALNEQVAGLRAGASGLGQRFGSATTGAEAALRATVSGQNQARNAQIAQQGYESAMQRMLAANEQLTGRQQFGQQFQSAAAQTLANLGLNLGQFGLQSAQTQMQQTQQNNAATQSGQGMQLNAIQQLLQAFQSRQGLNAQLLSMMFGLPAPQVGGFGQSASDIGQLLMFLPMLRNMGAGGTGGK